MQSSDFTQQDDMHKPQNGFEKLTPISNSGGTSLAYIAQIDSKQYFMKLLKPEHLSNQMYRHLYRKELSKGHSIRHPNIVKYEHLCENEHECYILMENIVGVTLDRFVMQHPHYFGKRNNIDKFFNQLLSGLKCLHENHVVYSDLKPQNIMITQVNNDVKIIDLGFCFNDSYTNTAGTTKEYAAPEHKTAGKLDVTTDIYGVGKIIEYIGHNSDSNIHGLYAKIMMRCLKEKKNQRFQDTDEIVRLINKRKHTIRTMIITALSCVALFLAYRTLIYNQHFLAWWDSFEIISRSVDYDTEYRHIYYRVLSEKDGTCEVVGSSSSPNIYIHEYVDINGKTYKVTHIADSAFSHKHYIKSVHIPDNVISIGKEAFRECKNMATINLSNSVTTVDDYAFYACDNVYNLKLSAQLKEIAIAAFCGSKIKKVVIPEGVTIIKLDAFGNCGNLQEVVLPSTLQTLERGSFYNCTKLESITIPANVTSMGDYLFYNCTNLKDIYNLASEPQSIPPIHKQHSQITLHVPAESVEKYRAAGYWQDMKIVAID